MYRLQVTNILVIMVTAYSPTLFPSLGVWYRCDDKWNKGAQSSSLGCRRGGLTGLGGSEDTSIERKSWTMSAAAVAVISAEHLSSEITKEKRRASHHGHTQVRLRQDLRHWKNVV